MEISDLKALKKLISDNGDANNFQFDEQNDPFNRKSQIFTYN